MHPALRLVLVALLALVIVALPQHASRYLLRRLPIALGTVLAATFIMFLLIELIPNNTRASVGKLDVRLVTVYLNWLGKAASGNLGRSSIGAEPVGKVLGRALPITLQLLLYSQVLALAVSVPLAAWSAWREGSRFDRAVTAFVSLAAAIPVYVIGSLGIIVLALGSLRIGPIPMSGRFLPFGRYVSFGTSIRRHFTMMILPCSALALWLIPPYVRVLRSDLINTAREDYLTAVRGRGVPQRRILFGHALRPSSVSLVMMMPALIGWAISNLLIIEELFSIPGIGDTLTLAVARRDTPTFLSLIAAITALVTVLNLIADAVSLTLDPRIAARANTVIV